MNLDIVNSNNKAWTLGEYLGGLRYESFKLGKRNPKFEKDLKTAVPKITNRELKKSREQLTQMSKFSEIPGIKGTDNISFREFSGPLSDKKPYLRRGGGGELHQKISEKINIFNQKHKFTSLGYDGGDVHDYGHVLTGFLPNKRGEVQQVVFDMYFQHMLRGLMPEETLGSSLQPNFKLAKLTAQTLSLLGDFNTMAKECNSLSAHSLFHSIPDPEIKQLREEIKRTDTFHKKVANVFLNKWTFPNGHDAKLVDKSLRAIQNFLKHRELLVNSGKLSLVNDLQKHWLRDEEIQDIANYAQFCALKCMENLAALSPEEKNKTIQQVMDENGYFNMELLERSTGLGTDNELKLPTYKKWREMLDKKPDINYDELITKATQSIKAKS